MSRFRVTPEHHDVTIVRATVGSHRQIPVRVLPAQAAARTAVEAE